MVIIRLVRGGIISLFAFSTVATAQAADMSGRMPVKAAIQPVPVYNWTGFYGGVFANYHAGKIDGNGCVGATCPVDPKLKGWMAGIHAGYDYQFANGLVAGIFAVLPLTQLSNTLSGTIPGFDAPTKTKFMMLGAARVGYAWDQMLPYVFAGVAHARVSSTFNFNNVTVTQNHTGFTLGAGLEYSIAPHISLDFRYSYVDLGQKRYEFVAGFPANWGERSHNFSIALNFRQNP